MQTSKIKILERLRAHVGGLGHAGRGPAQHAPARLIDTIILHRPDGLVVEAHQAAGDIGVFARIVGAADADVGLHAFHAGQLDVAHQPGVGGGGLEHQFAAEAGMARLDEREGAPAPGGAHQLDGELVGHIEHFEQDAVALFQGGGIGDQQIGQFFVTRISHKFGKPLNTNSGASAIKRRRHKKAPPANEENGLIPAPQSITNSRMRNRILLLLACCLGLYAGVSCTTRKAPSSSPQPPPGQTAADAKAEKEKQAARGQGQKGKAGRRSQGQKGKAGRRGRGQKGETGG